MTERWTTGDESPGDRWAIQSERVRGEPTFHYLMQNYGTERNPRFGSTHSSVEEARVALGLGIDALDGYGSALIVKQRIRRSCNAIDQYLEEHPDLARQAHL